MIIYVCISENSVFININGFIQGDNLSK